MQLSFEFLVSLGTALCTVVASFIVVRQKVSEIQEKIQVLFEKFNSIDTDLDKNNMETNETKKALRILSEINSPNNLRDITRERENHAVRLDTLEGQTIPNLIERVSKIEHQHNGSHPPVKAL